MDLASYVIMSLIKCFAHFSCLFHFVRDCAYVSDLANVRCLHNTGIYAHKFRILDCSFRRLSTLLYSFIPNYARSPIVVKFFLPAGLQFCRPVAVDFMTAVIVIR